MPVSRFNQILPVFWIITMRRFLLGYTLNHTYLKFLNMRECIRTVCRLWFIMRGQVSAWPDGQWLLKSPIFDAHPHHHTQHSTSPPPPSSSTKPAPPPSSSPTPPQLTHCLTKLCQRHQMNHLASKPLRGPNNPAPESQKAKTFRIARFLSHKLSG